MTDTIDLPFAQTPFCTAKMDVPHTKLNYFTYTDFHQF